MNVPGRNNGITGLVDFPRTGNAGVKFVGIVNGFTKSLKLSSIERAGRGDTSDWPSFRTIGQNGGLIIRGTQSLNDWPSPTQWKGEVGTVFVQYDEGKAETLTVRVEAAEVAYNHEKASSTYPLILSCSIIAEPVLTGFNSDTPQPTPGDETPADQQQWKGTQWLYDANGLTNGGQVTVDVWGGLGDTNASEIGRIATVIGNTTLPYPWKTKTATFERDSLGGGRCVITTSTTDTVEDVVNPITAVVTDVSHIEAGATVAGVNNPGSSPSGLIHRTTKTKTLNNGNTLIVDEYGLRTTQDDIQMPGTVKTVDVDNINGTATVCLVTGNSTQPGTPTAPLGVFVAFEQEQLNTLAWKHTFHYSNTGTLDKILFGDSLLNIDPDGLRDEQTFAVSNATSSAPASPPATPTGFKLRRRTAKRLSGTPEKWEHTYTFTRTTTGEDVERAETFTISDSNNVKSQVTNAKLNGTPTNPGGSFVLRDSKTTGLNDNNTLRVDEYGLRDTLEDIKFPGTVTEPDGSSIVGHAKVTLTAATSTLPGTPTAPFGVLIGTESEQVNRVLWRHTFYFANSTVEQKILFADSPLIVDPDGLQSEQILSMTTSSSATPGSPPGTPSGLKLRRRTAIQLAGTPTLWEHKFWFAKTTSAEDIENQQIVRKQGAVDDLPFRGDGPPATQIRVTTSATPPAVPASPWPGASYTGVETREIDDGHWQHKFTWEPVTDAERTQYGFFRETHSSSFNGDDLYVVAQMWLSYGTPPTVPTGIPSNVKLVSQTDHKLTGVWDVRVWTFAPTNWRDDKVFPHTKTDTDPNALETMVTTAQITGESTPSFPAGLKLRSTIIIPLTTGLPTNNYDLTIRTYGIRSTVDDRVYAFTHSSANNEEGNTHKYGSLVNVLSTDTVAAICASQYAALKSSINFAGVEVRKISDTIAEVVVTSKDSITHIQFESQMLGARLIPAYWDGSNVKVYLRRKWKRTTGKWVAEVVPQYRQSASMLIRIRKRVTTSGGINMQWALANTTNNASFLGLAAGTVTYIGAAGDVNWTDLPPMEIAYDLFADSNGIVELNDYNPGLIETATDLTSVTEHSWVNASSLGMSCALAAGANYTPLL